MKTIRNLLPLAVFLICLLIGYQISLSFVSTVLLKPELRVPFSQTVPTESVAAVLPNGQHSILLIAVDDLKSMKPRLESIWIMSYVDNNPHLTFLPVYPSQSEQEPNSDSTLSKEFRFTTKADGTQLNPTFLEALREQVPWWGSFLLMDRVALSRWVSNDRGVSDLPHAWEDPDAALLGQASLFQDLCWNSSRTEVTPDLRQVAQSLPGHVLSSLDQTQVYEQIEDVNLQISRFSCEFPTLVVPGTVISD